MPEKLQGNISFIQHDKDYCTIEYLKDGKKKTVNGSISGKDQQKLIEKKLTKKHHFHIGDTVSFELATSARGDRQVAENIIYLYNDALSNLLNQAKERNEFFGYLKLVGDQYFVKETGSYLFFPVTFSPWEVKPAAESLNDPVTFRIDNISNTEKLSASLKHQHFIPEFHKAEQLFRSKTSTPAKVRNISPHAVYLNLFGGKIKAKIPIKKESIIKSDKPLIIGDRIDVLITFISPKKIVVEKV